VPNYDDGVRHGRRNLGFERAGRFPADQIGLARARGVELVLAAVWREVAGEAIARRTRTLRVRRGVLEVEVSDDRWLETLRPLIPRLAGRLASLRPELRVRRFRLRGQGRKAGEGASPIAAPQDNAQASVGPSARGGGPQAVGESSPGAVTPERLEAVMERYLRRSVARRPVPSRRPR
jgi:hypothetical protein